MTWHIINPRGDSQTEEVDMSARQLLITIALIFGGLLGAPATCAAEPPQPEVARPSKPDMVENRIREKEPMSAGMKRDGMMKEDVRMHAEKMDKKMDEAMKREQERKKTTKE
jgi:hypothetical protein